MENLQPLTRHIEAEAAREAYLVQVSKQLSTRLSPLEMYETVEEMRAHVNAMALAYQEVGLSPIDAMKAALAKFGAADSVGAGADTSTGKAKKFSHERLNTVALSALANAFSGVIVFFLIDLSFVATGASSHAEAGIDCVIGSISGLIIGLVVSILRLSPLRGALVAVGLIDALVAGLILQTYRADNVVHAAPGAVFVFNVAAFVLGITGSLLCRYVSNALSRRHAARRQWAG